MNRESWIRVFSDIDVCASSPCQHGGTCTDLVAAFSCQCVSGYTDDVCQTGTTHFYINSQSDYERIAYETCILDINECALSPCWNGGTCTDHVAAYTCSCDAGYEGERCQTSKLTFNAMPQQFCCEFILLFAELNVIF